MLRYATVANVKTVYDLFASRKDIFPHVRQDALKRRIENQQCIFEDGVVITFQQYRKQTRAGTISIPAKSIMLHQIINGEQFNGAGGRMFERFFNEIVVSSGGELYLSVRAENTVACTFYERHGMQIAGRVVWSGGTLPGLIWKREVA